MKGCIVKQSKVGVQGWCWNSGVSFYRVERVVLKGGKGGVEGWKGGLEGCIHRRVMLYLQYLCVVSAYKGAEHTLLSMMLLLGAYSVLCND